MKSIHQYFEKLPISKWHYRYEINPGFIASKAFIETENYVKFIRDYFDASGKNDIFGMIDKLRRPAHVCSVFFLGIVLHQNIAFFNKIEFGRNSPEYCSFTFIWFLIALFHDAAYDIEMEGCNPVLTLDELIEKFNIDDNLLKKKFSKCKELIDSRQNYYNFRKDECGVIDHGILGGMLLYDSLLKIRREKAKDLDESSPFWKEELVKQYEEAAHAISIHNIWLQENDKICDKYKVIGKKDFKPVRYTDFPFFYLLGLIDTIEPLKASCKDDPQSGCIKEILSGINIEFGSCCMKLSKDPKSNIVFDDIIEKTQYLKGWLDVGVTIGDDNSFVKFDFR